MKEYHTEDPNIINMRAASIRQISLFTRFDRNKVSALLRDAELPWTPGPKGGRCYDLADAIQVLYNRPRELSPAGERNLAQAEKARVETAMLKRKYISLPELKEADEMFHGRVASIIEECPYPTAVRERVEALFQAHLASRREQVKRWEAEADK